MDSTCGQSRQQVLQTPSFTFNTVDTNASKQDPLQFSAAFTMTGNEIPKSEPTTTSSLAWTTPTSQPRPRPATIHEGFSYSFGDEYTSLQSWDSSSFSFQPTPSECLSRPVSMHQDLCSPTPADRNPMWTQKPYDDGFELHEIDSDMSIGQAYTTDEAIPILDLKFSALTPAQDGGPLNFDGQMNNRRMSGSSFTMSTSGALSDMPSYEDFSASLSEAPSFGSDYPPLSNRNSLMSSTHLSPVASPRMTPQSRSELVRTQSRGRASPSPRPGVRSAPYSVESARNKRWSTGSYGTAPSRRPSPYLHYGGHDGFATQRLSTQTSSPTPTANTMPLSYANFQAMSQAPFMMTSSPALQRNSMLLPSGLSSGLPSQTFHQEVHLERPPPLLSHGLFRMLQSNADAHSFHGHYADLSDPPDLFASLHEEQVPPPPEDMNPSDPDMVPHEQDLRFEGDLYTPRWVRGHGNKREGWCGICKPGRWLVLKNSAYWYDKSFSHGISAATGSPFQEPQGTRRMDGNPDVWEGLCGSCDDWIALVSSKKKGTTWFRHAYKCHSHPKVKDGPKRRRESSNTKALAASTMAKVKTELQQPSTPQSVPSMTSVSNTPTQAPTGFITSQQLRDKQLTPVPPPQPLRSVTVIPSNLLSPNDAYPDMI